MSKNLAQKMNAVMNEVTTVGKKGYNDFHRYAYAKESDYLEAIRPSLISLGIIVIPSLVSERKDGDLTSITMKFTLVNTDDPKDTYEVTIPAQGADKGDKGVYKAITGAKKYFVANTFLIPTNDDPEANEVDYNQQDKKTQPKATPAAPKSAQQMQTMTNTKPDGVLTNPSQTPAPYLSKTTVEAVAAQTVVVKQATPQQSTVAPVQKISSFRTDKPATATPVAQTKTAPSKGGW